MIERDIRWARWICLFDFFVFSKGTSTDEMKVAWLNITPDA